MNYHCNWNSFWALQALMNHQALSGSQRPPPQFGCYVSVLWYVRTSNYGDQQGERESGVLGVQWVLWECRIFPLYWDWVVRARFGMAGVRKLCFFWHKMCVYVPKRRGWSKTKSKYMLLGTWRLGALTLLRAVCSSALLTWSLWAAGQAALHGSERGDGLCQPRRLSQPSKTRGISLCSPFDKRLKSALEISELTSNLRTFRVHILMLLRAYGDSGQITSAWPSFLICARTGSGT